MIGNTHDIAATFLRLLQTQVLLYTIICVAALGPSTRHLGLVHARTSCFLGSCLFCRRSQSHRKLVLQGLQLLVHQRCIVTCLLINVRVHGRR